MQRRHDDPGFVIGHGHAKTRRTDGLHLRRPLVDHRDLVTRLDEIGAHAAPYRARSHYCDTPGHDPALLFEHAGRCLLCGSLLLGPASLSVNERRLSMLDSAAGCT